MRVTFDTNTLDRAVRPARFSKDPRQSEYLKVHEALRTHAIEGFFCETLVTLEGIQNKDRAAVFESTTIRQHRTDEFDAALSQNTVNLTLIVEQPKRQPLHPETVARVQAALSLGMRVLGTPRIAMPRIEDPDNKIYVVEPDKIRLGERLDKFAEVGRQIEARGLGAAQAKKLAEQFAIRDKMNEPWFRSLGRALGIHEERAVQRSIAEWADGDSIAAHIGYGLDLFCTEDKGNSAGGTSTLDDSNRAWLTSTYGVVFVTLAELAIRI